MSLRIRSLFSGIILAVAVPAAAQHTLDEPELFATCGGFLEGAAFDDDGALWVVDLVGGGIYSVDGQGDCTLRGETGGAPNGARFHPDGRLFVADNRLGIIAVDTRTMEQTVIVDNYRGDPIVTANDLVFDARGGIYFTDPNDSNYLDPKGRVFYLPHDAFGAGAGDALQVVAQNLVFPNGIALADNGQNILVGQLRDKSILKLPAVDSDAVFQGAHLYVRTLTGMGPDGIALGPDDQVFWAQFEGGSVSTADKSGQVNGVFPLGAGAGDYATNLAIHNGHLYVTEAQNGQIWRFAMLEE